MVNAKEGLSLVSAVIPLLNSEHDDELPDLPQSLCFLEGVKRWSDVLSVDTATEHRLRPVWFSHRVSAAGADAVNCLCLIWVWTSSARRRLFPSCRRTPAQRRRLARVWAIHMLLNVSASL